MPEGLTNALAGFPRFMNNIFADMIDVSVVVYDILVYSNSTEARATLDPCPRSAQLQWNWLYAQADKCEFHCNLCEYLGYMLSLSWFIP